MTISALTKAQELANVFDQYLALTRDQHMTGTAAALALNRPPSLFSGVDSMLSRYLRGGVAALVRDRRGGIANASDLTRRIEAFGWFIPAAKFFYVNTNLNCNRGSVPESVRRVVSLPLLPVGWRHDTVARFLKSIALSEPPVCPADLREELLARERGGQPLVPSRVARQITLSAAVIRQRRNPTNASLDFLSAPGSLFFFRDPVTGERRPPKPGEVIEADDSTINFPVCVPWDLGGDPCSDKFGVKVGRFQWLVSIDAARRFVTAWTYVMRPRSSYRGEDTLALMRAHCHQHGIPLVWRFEKGVWKSHLVQHAVKLMGSHLHTVWSPHQKPFIEGLFNTLWTKLSVHFPDADVGRFRGESEEASRVLVACQAGHQDPRQRFPMLKTAVAAFEEVIRERNNTPVNSDIGSWVPAEAWAARSLEHVRHFDSKFDWIFAPYAREWTVYGAQVGGKIRLFEDLAVPFDFAADWLLHYDGARVRCHFDPAEPDCRATIVLIEGFNHHKAGEIIGEAPQVNSIAGYARLVLGRAADPENASWIARQQSAAALRRELRAIVPSGSGFRASEERDGLATITRIEAHTRITDTTAAEIKTMLVQPRPATQELFIDHRGNGKIARLPKVLRDQVCAMILDGVPYLQIIERLGVAGNGITPQHICRWRERGYKAWLRGQSLFSARSAESAR
jgi:hypothetical protein